MDPVHVVHWATDALDKLRRQHWRSLKNAGWDVAARCAKGNRWPLLKNREHLTEEQRQSLADIQELNKPLYRAYLLKEQLRAVFQASGADVARALDDWLTWARRCRIPPMVEVSKSVTRHRAAIIASVQNGASNGFHSAEAIALAMLKHGGVCPPLPGRP